jgi:DNA polymerase, archaea type
MMEQSPMNFTELKFYENKTLFGYNEAKFITAVEMDDKSDPCRAILFVRENGKVKKIEEEFHPYVILSNLHYLDGYDGDWYHRELAGDNDYRFIVFCKNFGELKKLLAYLKETTGTGFGNPQAPYLYYSDLIQQYLMITGKTLFKGMIFDDVVRMQIDIETYTKEGYEFSNPEREEDRIIVISMSDSTGWERVLSGMEFDEASMIREMIKEINERDPDVIEGHNFHRFDLYYIETRAKRYRIPLKFGRDNRQLVSHNSRINIAERTITYKKYQAYGRHIIDTWLLAQLYDISTRELESYGLKDIAKHFQVVPDDRTYVDQRDISKAYDTDPEMLCRYAMDDVRETKAISRILSSPYFIQTQIFPLTYQNVTVRGNATRIDTLFIREYLRQGFSIPRPPERRAYTGAYTDIFKRGLVHHVLHVDVASLYPSIMLSFKYFPSSDKLNIFESMLRDLREFRLEAKREARKADTYTERDFLESMQSTFKILINSFYGYLGFSMGHFADFDLAEKTTSKGREIIKTMVSWLQEKNCTLIELDTDGIYFQPPPDVKSPESEDELVEQLNSILPAGIKLELDGRYRSMFSYKMKNYALLSYEGKMLIKGSGLKSRGLEYFQRKFIEEMFRLLLNDKKDEIDKLLDSYHKMIMNHDWDVKWFQKIDTLQESLAGYVDKVESGARNPASVYELALKSGRDYQPGDQISYYITGDKATVTAYRNCKFAYKWDKNNPDENTKYYASKLNSLYKKFSKDF